MSDFLGASTFNKQRKRVVAKIIRSFCDNPINKTYCCFLNDKAGFVSSYPDYFVANTGTPSTIVQ